MTLTAFSVALLRYFFNLGFVWMQESYIWMHGLVFLLGSSYTLLEDKHVRIDIFYSNFRKKTQKNINLIGTFFLLIPTCALIIITSWDYVISSILLLESSKEAGGLPILYILKTYILFLCITLFFQGVSEILKSLVEED